MVNKLYIMLALSFFPLIASENTMEAISSIKSTLSHIAQEKEVIRKIAIKTILIGVAAKKMVKMKTNSEDYANFKKLIKESLYRIIQSKEFIHSINFVTDYQVECVVNKLMTFNDIEYNSQDYPLEIEQKIQEELSTIFIEINEQTEQVFNIFYVTLAGSRGCQMLLEKLTLKEQQLISELETLEATSETSLDVTTL